ncbi:MAG: aminotransferase class I/II-fold pyridoxal phosphate-dependent enzyme [Acidobacteria bacterium]|nr:aminotransferase class I/II-fold pyridoxal phosphate-dependent enzyme [Acidobacteriota bacterium]
MDIGSDSRPSSGCRRRRATARLSSEDDTEFHERLLREAGVAAVPGSVFYPLATNNPKRLRFTFSKSRATIEEAARRLARFRG